MSNELILDLSAVLALIPAALLGLRRASERDAMFWMMLAIATLGPFTTVAASLSGGWHTDFATSLWATIAASMVLFSVIAVLTREAWRLTPLITAYMVILGLLATVWGHAGDPQVMAGSSSGPWVGLHIAVSVGTYGLVTIAAVAALGAVFQERALKTKRQTPLNRLLPSVADCDGLVVQLLAVSEIVLGLGLISGMALQFAESHEVLALNHKSILTFTAFFVIGGVLIAHFKTGLRGRKAARIVLLAYLLMTLGYPGVKFVSDVILG
jgi:ABC-type uncharacterized transport system permease subunit